MVKSSALQKYSLFGGLLEEQINQILPLMEQEDYQAGENIIVEGQPNDKIRFILNGRVAVVKNHVTLIEFNEGDAFGEMEVLDVMPSAATNVALEPTRVMSISNRALRSLYKIDIKAFSLMLMNLARDLSRRLRKMNDMVTDSKPPAESS
jgi:CRP-like cAMP-binding protein